MPHSQEHRVTPPYAMAIDIGSSSVRAVLFDAKGRQIHGSEHRERYKLTLTPDGGSMADPLRMRARTAKCVRKVAEKNPTLAQEVAVVGISCHWHSLMGVDHRGEPVTPLYMWADSRSRSDADALENLLDPAANHARTGCPLHSSYWPAKLRWLNQTQANLADQVHTWCGLSDWLFAQPDTPITTSLSMASATGMFDSLSMDWDATLAGQLDLDIHRFPAVIDRITPFDPPSDLVLPGLNATWYPAIGDGAAANIGAGAIGSDRMALTIGTSGALRLARQRSTDSAELPSSVWRYLIDADTEVIGGALSGGGNILAWISQFAGTNAQELMAAAARMEPDGHGLTMLPFLAGERAPSWSESISGAIAGLTLDTSAAEIYRAALEASAYRFAAVYEDLQPFTAANHDIIASGGALLQSPLWQQIVTDALGHPLSALQSRAEVSARGAAIAALHAAGIIPSLRTDPDIRSTRTPNAAATTVYSRGRARLERLERALITWEQH